MSFFHRCAPVCPHLRAPTTTTTHDETGLEECKVSGHWEGNNVTTLTKPVNTLRERRNRIFFYWRES
jgi:hypothetical protein